MRTRPDRKEHHATRHQYQTTRDRFLDSRKMGPEPRRKISWLRERHLLYTAISLALVIVATFVVRGFYRLHPQLKGENAKSSHQEEMMDYDTAVRLFSGNVSATTKTEEKR